MRAGDDSRDPGAAMIAVRCPKCRQVVGVRPEAAGKVARCPGCRQLFRAPSPTTAGPRVLPDDPDDFVSELDVVEEAPAESAPDPDEEPIEAEVEEESAARPARRRRRKRRRPGELESAWDTFRYYTAAFGIFPWIAAGLVGFWFFLSAVAVLLPPASLAVVAIGLAVYGVGWVWFVVTAFKDDTFHGMLCVVTHFYWVVYLVVNPNEAWRPACLTIIGGLMSTTGWLQAALLLFNRHV